ncbi:MAG: nitrogenase molybdenum-iron protein alpha chain [bacterium]
MAVNFKASEEMVEEILNVYSEKAKKNRKEHFAVNNKEACGSCIVKSNVKSLPGVMTPRGCAYAGSKGVVWGPVKDVINISHGPIGCGMYSWGTRRNLANGEPGVENFMPFQFTTDFKERDIVFGGDKKLEQAIKELHELFPTAKGIIIDSECPIGLIGDDIEAVAKKMTDEIKVPVIPVRCEGFRGVSQSLGHHIANDTIRDFVVGTGEIDESKKTPYDVAILGDYNIGGDVWSSMKIFKEMGLNVVAHWSGDGSIEEMKITHGVNYNLLHCYRSMNYIARHFEEKFGIPWIEYNFFGPTKIKESIRNIAKLFDENIQEKSEEVIKAYEPKMQEVIDKYRPGLEGKKVMILVGGLRPRHIVGAYEDLGMKVVSAAYEFAHSDDYERTAKELGDGTIITDDMNEYEFVELANRLKPDLVASGIKEKYVFQKMGIPFRQMHSWDYSGPYHGYEGFEIFARDMDLAINSPSWKLVKPLWKK